MKQDSWNNVKSKMSLEVTELEKHVKGYDYSSKEQSLVTDEKICAFLVEELRKIKMRLFDLSDLAYENHEDRTSDMLTTVRDSIEVLSDEIKVRYCEFKDLPEEFVEKLVRHDYELLKGLQELRETLEGFYHDILHFEKIDIGLLESKIDGLVKLFKEREAICNIRQISLEKTFEKIKQDISSRV